LNEAGWSRLADAARRIGHARGCINGH
jgi:hypothetical protein